MLIGVVAAAVTAVAMVVLIGRLAGFSKVRDVLAEAHPEWLIVCVLGQMLVFAGYAGAFRWTVRADDGPTVALGLSIRVVLASFAATQVFSFAGIGGLAVMYLVLRRYERDAQAAAVRLIGLNTAVYLVFGVIGWFAAAVALATGDAPLGMTVPWLIAIPIVMLAARWFSAPNRVTRWTEARSGVIRRALGTGIGATAWVRRRLTDTGSRPLFCWAACYWIGDIASLWAALNAFGGHPGLVALTAAYTTGYLVQSLPIPLIATAGVDTATVLLLRTVGVPLDVALLGVVTHRVFAFWIPLVPGSVFALTLLPTQLRSRRRSFRRQSRTKASSTLTAWQHSNSPQPTPSSRPRSRHPRTAATARWLSSCSTSRVTSQLPNDRTERACSVSMWRPAKPGQRSQWGRPVECSPNERHRTPTSSSPWPRRHMATSCRRPEQC